MCCFRTLQAFSVVIAGFISEAAFTSSDPIVPSAIICYNNGGAFKSGHRICHNGLAAAIASILVCMMLLIFDAFVPCLNRMVSLDMFHCQSKHLLAYQ